MITDGMIAAGALFVAALIGYTFLTSGVAHGLLAVAVFCAPLLWGTVRHGGANR